MLVPMVTELTGFRRGLRSCVTNPEWGAELLNFVESGSSKNFVVDNLLAKTRRV